MAGEWHSYKIGELGKVITGKTPSTTEPENFGGPYPFITIPDLVQKVYIDTSERTLSEIGASKMKTLLLPPNSVMMSCIATIGKCGITTKPSFTNQQINSVICNPDIVDPLFLYYVFTQIGHQLESAGGGGSVYTNVSKSRFSEISVLLPPLPEQRTIAAVLGALDDKIELNRRMNRTLEAMAQAVFRHWFVENEEAEGWKIGDVSYFAQVRSGERPMTTKKIADAEYKYPLFGGGGIMAYTNKSLYDSPILLTGRVGTLGGIFRISYPCWASDNTLVLIPLKPENYYYLYFHLKQIDFEMLNRGSTQPLLTQSDLQKIEAPLPPDRLLGEFTRVVSPIFAKIDANEQQSRTLAALRDALLPKLLRGEVRVTVHE